MSDRTKWATPAWLVARVAQEIGAPCTFDLCAEQATAKAPDYCGPDHPRPELRDAFTAPLTEVDREGFCWCNPPFKRMTPWANLALKVAEEFSAGLVFLTPPKTDQPWFHRMHSAFNSSLCLLSPRVHFEPPPGVEASRPTGPVILFHVTPSTGPAAHVRRLPGSVYFDKELRP